MVQDLILQRFQVEYHPHYLANLLDQLGFSFQKARFVSDHLNEAARERWLQTTWPEILQTATERKAATTCSAMKPVSPNGDHSTTPGHLKANNRRSRPVAYAKAIRSLA